MDLQVTVHQIPEKPLFCLTKLTDNGCLESYSKGKAPPVGPFRPMKKILEKVCEIGILSGGCEHLRLPSRTNYTQISAAS